MSTNPDKTRRLECCCCGEDADEIRSNYGVEGVNYAPAASIAMEG